MNEVSCHVARTLLGAAEKEGFDPAQVLRGLSIAPDRLEQPLGRMDWDSFAALCDHLDGAGQDDDTAERLAARMLLTQPYELLRRLAGVVVDPRDMYELAARWVMPLAFLSLRSSLTEQPDGRLLFVLELREGYRPSRGFFRISRGCMTLTSTLIGLPPAMVDAEISDRRGAYSIKLPPGLPLRARARRAARALLGVRALLDEMKRQGGELRRSYEDLLRVEQDLRSVLESIPEPVVIHRDGQILWANPAAARCVGVERATEIIGRHALELVHPDDRGRLLRRGRAPGDVAGEEVRFVRRDGEVVTLEVAPPREIRFEGAPARLVMAHDVSERRRIQERLMLSDRMASLGTLAAGVAHEINNPLAYIYLNLEIAARELATLGDRRLARAEGAIADAIEGAARVRAIVGDLKTFARAGGEPLGPVDVREVLDSAAGLAANELRRRARIVREYGATPPAQANQSRLGQVFLNLLLNAADAIPEGRPDDHEIRIRTFTDEAGRVNIEVTDTGAGIPEAHLGRIFDPFFTTKSPGKGTGLGLSICHHIITELGGEITAQSIEGKGSTFRVALPASSEALRDAAGRPYLPTGRSRPPRLAGRPSGTRLRVLIVDDEPALVRSLELILGRHYQVVVAASSAAALHLLQRLDVDVILCDLMMAGMSGMELSATIAATRPDLLSRMIFMTGGAYTDEAHAFLAKAQHRCLLKPFSERDVLDIVAQVALAPRSARASSAPPSSVELASLSLTSEEFPR